jgi:hypothetical protein
VYRVHVEVKMGEVGRGDIQAQAMALLEQVGRRIPIETKQNLSGNSNVMSDTCENQEYYTDADSLLNKRMVTSLTIRW